jgi:hypothetical protein
MSGVSNRKARRASHAFSGSYDPVDVQILLKPTKIVPTPVDEKEALIQSGQRHYSEMLSPERVPDARYMALFHDAMARNLGRLRADIDRLARQIGLRSETAAQCVLVSLARAGTPVGVLLARQLRRIGIKAHHYSISIIRGRGIDVNTMRFILDRHDAGQIVFVDGWTGKGAITRELMRHWRRVIWVWRPFSRSLRSGGLRASGGDERGLRDPQRSFERHCIGAHQSFGPNDMLVGPGDFHACLFMEEHRHADLSRTYVDAIDAASRRTPERAVVGAGG